LIAYSPQELAATIVKIGKQEHCHIFGGFSNKTQQNVSEALEFALIGTQFRRMAICVTENSPDVAVPVLQKEVGGLHGRLQRRSFLLKSKLGVTPTTDEALLPRDQRRKLLGWMIYCAYLNYPARSIQIAKRISNLHHDQCWKHGDSELCREDSNFVLFPKCFDRQHGRDTAECRTADLGYTDMVVAPAFAYLAQKLPGMRLALYNVARWRASLGDGDASANGINDAVCAMESVLTQRQQLHQKRAAAALRAEQLQQQQLKDARIAHEQAEAARMREIINGKTDEEGDADQLIPSAEASVNKAGPTVEVAFSATVYVDSNCIVWCLVVRGV